MEEVRFFISDHQFLFNDLLGMLNTVLTNMSFLAGDKDFNFIAASATK